MTNLRRFIADLIRDLLESPPPPDSPAAIQHGDRFMALRYRLVFAAPKAADVTEREMLVTENGTDKPAVVVPVSVLDAEFVVADGAAVSVKTRDKDDAGNYSTYSPPLAFTAADTIPPGAPDMPTVELVGEE